MQPSGKRRMRRIRPVTRTPERAASIAPEVKLTFITQVLTDAIPLFTNKDPQNSINTGTSAR
jgi:hypothetical protein